MSQVPWWTRGTKQNGSEPLVLASWVRRTGTGRPANTMTANDFDLRRGARGTDRDTHTHTRAGAFDPPVPPPEKGRERPLSNLPPRLRQLA